MYFKHYKLYIKMRCLILIFTKLIRGIKTLGIVALLLTSIYTTTLIILQLITIKTVKDIYIEIKNNR